MTTPSTDLPFDPDQSVPELDPEQMSAEQRSAVAAHAHYHLVRGALDLVSLSSYLASLAGVPDELLGVVEQQAYVDDEEEPEAEESSETLDP